MLLFALFHTSPPKVGKIIAFFYPLSPFSQPRGHISPLFFPQCKKAVPHNQLDVETAIYLLLHFIRSVAAACICSATAILHVAFGTLSLFAPLDMSKQRVTSINKN